MVMILLFSVEVCLINISVRRLRTATRSIGCITRPHSPAFLVPPATFANFSNPRHLSFPLIYRPQSTQSRPMKREKWQSVHLHVNYHKYAIKRRLGCNECHQEPFHIVERTCLVDVNHEGHLRFMS